MHSTSSLLWELKSANSFFFLFICNIITMLLPEIVIGLKTEASRPTPSSARRGARSWRCPIWPCHVCFVVLRAHVYKQLVLQVRVQLSDVLNGLSGATKSEEETLGTRVQHVNTAERKWCSLTQMN